MEAAAAARTGDHVGISASTVDQRLLLHRIKLNHVSVLQKMTNAMIYCMSFILKGKEVDGPY
jgi:hypothetical protein